MRQPSTVCGAGSGNSNDSADGSARAADGGDAEESGGSFVIVAVVVIILVCVGFGIAILFKARKQQADEKAMDPAKADSSGRRNEHTNAAYDLDVAASNVDAPTLQTNPAYQTSDAVKPTPASAVPGISLVSTASRKSSVELNANAMYEGGAAPMADDVYYSDIPDDAPRVGRTNTAESVYSIPSEVDDGYLRVGATASEDGATSDQRNALTRKPSVYDGFAEDVTHYGEDDVVVASGGEGGVYAIPMEMKGGLKEVITAQTGQAISGLSQEADPTITATPTLYVRPTSASACVRIGRLRPSVKQHSACLGTCNSKFRRPMSLLRPCYPSSRLTHPGTPASVPFPWLWLGCRYDVANQSTPAVYEDAAPHGATHTEGQAPQGAVYEAAMQRTDAENDFC